MSNKKLKVVIEPTKDGLWAHVPALPGCISYGKDFGEIKSNLCEAIELHIEGMQEDGEAIPLVNGFDKNLQFNFDLSTFFEQFPIAISGFDSKFGIDASLLRQYVTGKKYLSLKQTIKIQDAIRNIGREISNVSIL